MWQDRVGADDYENAKRKKQREHEDSLKDNRVIQTRPNQHKTLYVHMVPHTHDDLGWLKTVDDYYSGSNQEAHHASVELILDSVVDQMTLKPHTKFTYVEMKFFQMWWSRQNNEVK